MRRSLNEDINRIRSLMLISEGEAQLSSSDKALVDKFIDFIKKELNIKHDVQVNLQNDKEGIKTTAVYKYEDGGDESKAQIKVFAKDRAIVDIIRSIAHEFIHHQQNERGKLKGIKNYTSGPIEDEANSSAGELLKKFGKSHPEIYEKEEMKEQDDGDSGAESGSSDGSSDSANANVSTWETGVTRGKANPIDNTVWSTGLSRGKGNPLGDEGKWETGLTRGKANSLF